jgi:SLT domain-containing protein
LFDTGRKVGNFTLGKGFTVDGRANGGPVSGNKPYLVGERGAELFVPNTSGMILNANRTRGMGNTINITINARDTSDTELRRIADKIGNMVNNKISRRTSTRTLG